GHLCGEGFLRNGDFRRQVQPGFLKYVRADEDLAAISADCVLDETRVNPDGTLDFIRWSRPQHDGAALEALVAIRFGRDGLGWGAEAGARLAQLIRRDLDYAAARVGGACYDIWEEELGQHYYPRLVQCAALEAGAEWIAAEGDPERARRYRAAAERLLSELDSFWSPDQFYRSRLSPPGTANSNALDMSVLLAILHPGRARACDAVADRPALRLRLSAQSRARARLRHRPLSRRPLLQWQRLVSLLFRGGGIRLSPRRIAARTRACGAQRRDPRRGARVRAGHGRALGAVPSGNRRAALGARSHLELRRVHNDVARAPRGARKQLDPNSAQAPASAMRR